MLDQALLLKRIVGLTTYPAFLGQAYFINEASPRELHLITAQAFADVGLE